jgi:hypothetical protein
MLELWKRSPFDCGDVSMKVRIKYVSNDCEFVIEANPRLRDLESTTKRIVNVTIDSTIKLGLATRADK